MDKKDFRNAVAIGVLTALVWVPVVERIAGKPNSAWWYLAGIVIVPGVFLIGLQLGLLLSRWKKIIYPLAKYCAIGFLNTGIDFALFDLLIFWTGIEKGASLALFKGIGFAAGLVNSYFWNKYWAFAGTESKGSRAREFFTFAAVTLVGIALNIGITAAIANAIRPPFGFTQFVWDNAAAALATVSNLVWNFVGYHLIVFRKTKNTALEGAFSEPA